MNVDAVKWLHVEASSRCNAWCPACPRNVNGFGLRPGLVETDLDIDSFVETLNALPNLEAVQFCGNDGDPIAHRNFIDLIDLIPDDVFVQIHTNGSLRNRAWWKQLAQSLEYRRHEIYFGIDGLKDTHRIYRQNTDWNKIIANASEFINNKGTAVWQFIPFKHNQHQFMECYRLSQQLGFRDFKVVKTFRYHKSHARDFRTGEEYMLEPSDFFLDMWNSNKPAEAQDCMHLSIPSVYLDAQGRISACCYLADSINFKNTTELFAKLQIDNNVIASTSTCQFWCSGLSDK